MMLVCIGEFGDRSQVSIIYLAGSQGFGTILASIIIANFILCILSSLCGQVLATRFSVKTLTLISGWLFIILGFIALIMTAYIDFGLFHFSNSFNLIK